MFEIATVAFATFFATIGPLDVAVVYTAMTANQSEQQRRSMAYRGVFVSTLILLVFALAGDGLLAVLGITLPALRIAGGVLLLLIALDMVFARSSGGTSTTKDEKKEASGKEDLSVFPLATPLIAGPGAMGAVILLMANQNDDIAAQAVVVAALLAVLLLTGVCLLLGSKIQSLIGITGMHVVTRVMGVLLSALAVQFMLDGIVQTGLFGQPV